MQEQCQQLLQVAKAPGGADPDAAAALARCPIFARRCRKLAAMFSTIHQFSTLEAHSHIEGLPAILAKSAQVVDEMRTRPYDLLDCGSSSAAAAGAGPGKGGGAGKGDAFDRDILEFQVKTNDLEGDLQGLLATSFAACASTEQALGLLAQFEGVLGREPFRADLDSKYAAAFQAFAGRLAGWKEALVSLCRPRLRFCDCSFPSACSRGCTTAADE